MRTPLSIALIIVVASAARTAATVYLPADFAEMVAASVYIVHGTIADVRSDQIADRRSIVTYVTVDVAEPLKGAARNSVTFLVPGGRVGAYERVVVGAPRFEPGDEVIVFLTARGPSVPYVFGLTQGVYRVSRASGQPLVLPAMTAGAGEGAAGPLVRGDPARRPLPLDQFTREVRARMERPR